MVGFLGVFLVVLRGFRAGVDFLDVVEKWCRIFDFGWTPLYTRVYDEVMRGGE